MNNRKEPSPINLPETVFDKILASGIRPDESYKYSDLFWVRMRRDGQIYVGDMGLRGGLAVATDGCLFPGSIHLAVRKAEKAA